MYLIRACNMDKVSVVGERAAPRCSQWTVDKLVAERGAKLLYKVTITNFSSCDILCLKLFSAVDP